MQGISRFFRRIFQNPSFLKLKDEAPILKRRVETLKDNPDYSNIYQELLVLRADLDNAILERETQQGWKLFKEMRRMLIRVMTMDELKSKAQTIIFESKSKTKESPWRLLAIKEVLGAKEDEKQGLRPDLNAIHVVKAAEILDEHQDNFYEKLGTLRRRIRTLSWTTFLSLLIWVMIGPKISEFPYATELSKDELTETKKAIDEMVKKVEITTNKVDSSSKDKGAIQSKILNKSDSLKSKSHSSAADTNTSITQTIRQQSNAVSDRKNEASKSAIIDSLTYKPTCCAGILRPFDVNKEPRLLAFLVILTGIIGAVVSGFIRTINAGMEGNIPDQIFGTTILAARLMLAAAASLTVYVFLGTGVVLLFGSKVSFELLLAFAFVAGFSEQLVKRGVEALSKQELYSTKDKPGK